MNQTERFRDLPRFWSFSMEFFNHFRQRLFRIAELDHTAEIYLTTEEIRMHKFTRGKERSVLIY